MAVELHLPDLPEVRVALGPARGGAPRPRLAWHLRLRDLVSAYLPLLLMLLLALGTWWLVKNTPGPAPARDTALPRGEPDYTMQQFVLQRFDDAGRLTVRVEGSLLRHFPDTDRVEIDQPSIRATAPDGRVTLAGARRAIANGDASELQLLGGASVGTRDGKGLPIEMRGEFLHLFLVAERVRTHLPVSVAHGRNRLHAAGIDLDLPARRLDFQGPVRATLATAAP